MNLSELPFSPSTRKAGSLESSGRRLKFSYRMAPVIGGLNDEVHPSRDYVDEFESPKPMPRRSREPEERRQNEAQRRKSTDDDDLVITDVTNQYTSSKPPQPKGRPPVMVKSWSDPQDDEDVQVERPPPPLRKKNLDLAPLPDSEIRIKTNKNNKMMPTRVDESNFREAPIRNRQSQENQSQRRGAPSRRLSVDTDAESVFGNEIDDDSRSVDMGPDEVEIYPDEPQTRNSVDLTSVKQDFDYPIFNLLQYNTLDFIQTPAHPGQTIKCKLIMNRGVFNEFVIYLEGYSGYDLPIMMTRRRRAVPYIYYYIDALYIERNSSKGSKSIPFGRLSSNIKRKDFNLVGNRTSEKAWAGSTSNLHELMSLDQQLNTPTQVVNEKKYLDLTFNTKLFGTTKPKEFVVDVLINQSAEEAQQSKEPELRRSQSSLSRRDTSDNFRRVSKRVTLLNKKAEYDPITKKYRLDFRGRAKKPSANNIQVIEESDTKKVLMQLGKVKSKCYYLDYSDPLCAFQAFGIAVSCLSRN